MNKHNKRRGLDTYVVFAVIILLVIILIYYALTVGNEKQLSVGITSWTLTSIACKGPYRRV